MLKENKFSNFLANEKREGDRNSPPSPKDIAFQWDGYIKIRKGDSDEMRDREACRSKAIHSCAEDILYGSCCYSK